MKIEWVILDLSFKPCTKRISKWIKNLRITAKPIKFIGEYAEENIHALGFGNGFLDMTSKAYNNYKKKLNWTSLKLKIFVPQKTLSRK